MSNLYIVAIIILLANTADSIILVETGDRRYDDDVLYYTYCNIYDSHLMHLKIPPTYLPEFLENAKIEHRYKLPQFDGYDLYVIKYSLPGYSELDFIACTFMRSRYLGKGDYGFKTLYFTNTLKPLGELDGIVGYEVDSFILAAIQASVRNIPSSTGFIPGELELGLVLYYLNECYYKNIAYIYNDNFHILDPDGLPNGLQNLKSEDKEVLEKALDNCYHRGDVIGNYQSIREYKGFCTWSEYGGELVFWEYKVFNNNSNLEFKYEVIGNIGDYQETNTIIERPAYWRYPSIDWEVDYEETRPFDEIEKEVENQ